MDTILQGLPNVFCYTDDILITGPDDDTHLRNLTAVLERLQRHGVRMKKAKCRFMAKSVIYLGHKIDSEGLHTTTDKVDAVVNAPEPRNVQQLRSFLGLVNYYRKFLPNLSTVLRPLNSLLQKSTSWSWTVDCKRAFNKVKSCVVECTVLGHYNPDLPLRLAADASAYGIGAVISHVMPNGEERPIAFASRTLQPSECNYAQLEKEALALIFGIKKFHQYLFGRQFTLITHHKPLLAILGPKKGVPSLAAARLQRWALLLSAYNYQLEFKPTEQHSNADGLSRLPLQSQSSLGGVPEASIHNIRQIEAIPITSQAVKCATRKDKVLSKVLHYTRNGWPTQIPEPLKPFSTRRLEITVEAGCLLWGVRIIIPAPLQSQLLKELHHGHPGISKMKATARHHMWWPHLDQDIEKLVKNCQVCKAVKPGPPTAPLHPWSWPAKPWQRVHIDFAGPIHGKSFLLAVDSHSKWPEVFQMAQTTATHTIEVLRQIFARYGLPQQLVSDNGPQFRSEEFQAFARENGIRHTFCAPYHPSSNGSVERLVQTFKRSLQTSAKDGYSLNHRIANFLLSYRTTPHTTTGVTPASLFVGRELRTKLDLLKPDINRRVCEKQARQKEDHDKRVIYRSFTAGEKVMVKNFRSGDNWLPATVTQQNGPLSYTVCTSDGQIWKHHVDHIKSLGSQPVRNEFTLENDDYLDIPTSNTNAEDPTSHVINDSSPTTSSESTPTVDPLPRYPRRARHPPERFEGTLLY